MTAAHGGNGPADPPADAPADAPARAAIREELDLTLFVEAGAGTGKTTALVGRIVELVATGRARIDEIAAITFTEAAAAELRDRVGEELERLASGDTPTAGWVAAGPDGDAGLRRARAEAALADVDAAAIGTLHGFARRLLADHPFQAGLPPTFEVLDEVRSAVAFDERWTDFLDDLLGNAEHGPAVSRALVCGIGLGKIRELAVACNRNWDLVADHPWPVDPPPDIQAAAVLEPLGGALALAGACTAPDDLLLAHLDGLGEWTKALAAAAGAGDQLEVLRLLVGSGRLAPRIGRKGNWDGRIDQVRDLLGRAEAAKHEIVATVAVNALGHLMAALAALTLRSARERRREGRLEYHDLLVQCRDLLRSRPDVARLLGTRYRFLFIDEFQDTDPIQAELAVRLASEDPATGAEHWTELGLPPGRLFFVGDPKQSIYRFRRADIAQFMAVRDRYADRTVQLTASFRSVPGVVDWVNAVFGDLLGDVDRPGQPRYEPLRASRGPHPTADNGAAGPPVVVLGGGDPGRPSADQVRRAEGADIAAVVRQVVARGWPVGPEGRGARLGDIAVLVPSRTGLPILQGALDDAGIPYRLEAASLVYSTAEVRDLMVILRAVDNPADQLAVVAALRSVFFGCGDDDLVEFHAAGGRWDYREPPPHRLAAGHPVVEGLRALHGFHADRWWCEVSQLVERVVADRRMLALGLDRRRPREVWRRLRFVVDEARTFADAFGGDLRRYVAWAEHQGDEGSRVAEVVLPEPDDDAVRIMTVHAAKGLEFPVVVLAGLGGGRGGRSGPDLLWGPDGPQVRIPGSVETPGYPALALEEAEMGRLEGHRLLYVAATRARDHLVVSLHHKAGTDCAAARIEAACAAVPDLWRRFEPAGPVPDPAPGAAGGSASSGGSGVADPGRAGPVDLVEEADRTAWQERRRALVERAGRPSSVAATAVAKLVAEVPGRGALENRGYDPDAGERDARAGLDNGEREDAEREDADREDGARPTWRSGRAGTAVGRAVHGTLQRVDLATARDLSDLVRAQAVAEGVPERAVDVERLVRAALDSPPVRQAVLCGRYWRELYVGVPVGDRVLEGIVDLLVDGPGGLQVVDYKTDRTTTDADVARLVDRYRPQGAAYALAVQRALGRPVARCTFVFLRHHGAVAVDLDDLDGAMAQVLEVVTAP